MADDTRPFKTVDEIADEIARQCAAAPDAQAKLSERLINRMANAMRVVAKIPFIVLEDHERGSGGKVTMPKPNVFEFPDPGATGDVGRGSWTPPIPPSNPEAPIPPPIGTGVPKNALDIVTAVRAKYPTPLRDSTLLAFLRETARALGPDAGLVDKPTGNNVQGYSRDLIMFKSTGEIYDVLVGVEAQAKPCFSYAGLLDKDRWRSP